MSRPLKWYKTPKTKIRKNKNFNLFYKYKFFNNLSIVNLKLLKKKQTISIWYSKQIFRLGKNIKFYCLVYLFL